MSAIQASILSQYNERNVGLSTIFGSQCSGGGRPESGYTTNAAGGGGGETGGYSTQQRQNSRTSRLSKLNPRRPVVDMIVILMSVPSLIILALMLEANLRENWAETTETRWTVLGLGLGLIVVCLILCGYATHRMGVCLWAGPLDDSDNSGESTINRENSIMDIYNTFDYLPPPSYDSVMECDIMSPPPPYYDCVVLQIDKKCEFKCIDAELLATNYI